jgi:hypothetical protein
MSRFHHEGKFFVALSWRRVANSNSVLATVIHSMASIIHFRSYFACTMVETNFWTKQNWRSLLPKRGNTLADLERPL